MGHLTIVGDATGGDGDENTDSLLRRAREARDSLEFV
jgi:hypothetical protein